VLLRYVDTTSHIKPVSSSLLLSPLRSITPSRRLIREGEVSFAIGTDTDTGSFLPSRSQGDDQSTRSGELQDCEKNYNAPSYDRDGSARRFQAGYVHFPFRFCSIASPRSGLYGLIRFLILNTQSLGRGAILLAP
jgi:hypothetical protein